ncbi:MAG: sec-independent protein translocase protein TatB [Kiritimatiellia bacterium]|jgi:sec-independent protein translocase protein TatB
MGLFEILLIAVVALLVVGPERMPEAVRSVALTIGRVKRFLSSAREEIEKQVGADEIRQQLHNEAVMDQLAKQEASAESDNSLEVGEVNAETLAMESNSILDDTVIADVVKDDTVKAESHHSPS